MGEKSLNLMHKYMNSQLKFDLVDVATKTLTHFFVQHHKLIMHNHKVEHKDHDGRKTLKISKQLYTNIFLSCKPTVY
jgi:hypothetical protein